MSPGWSLHAISSPNYPFIENAQIDIHVSMLYPWTIDVNSTILKLMDFSEWILPWPLQEYFHSGG